MVAGWLRQLDPWGPGSESLSETKLNQRNGIPLSLLWPCHLVTNNRNVLLALGKTEEELFCATQAWWDCYSQGNRNTGKLSDSTDNTKAKETAAHHWKNLQSEQMRTTKSQSIMSPRYIDSMSPGSSPIEEEGSTFCVKIDLKNKPKNKEEFILFFCKISNSSQRWWNIL